MSRIYIFDGYHHGSLLIKDGELFFNDGLETSAHEDQDGKGYRQLVDDCTVELARLAERNKELEAVAEIAQFFVYDRAPISDYNYHGYKLAKVLKKIGQTIKNPTGGECTTNNCKVCERRAEKAQKKAGYLNE